MDTVTVQTKNVDAEIRDKAEKIVRKAGFSSLQEVIRIMIVDIANERLPVNMDWGAARDPDVRKALQEYEEGKVTRVKKGQLLSDALQASLCTS
jgi:antitoxin component of RelBE/YafQ-DinJ toxin-antitoxin module